MATRAHRQVFLSLSRAEQLFVLYDTNQVISPLEGLEKILPKVKVGETAKYAQAIVDYYSARDPEKKITRGEVSHYLYMHQLPASLADIIYVEIKTKTKKIPKKGRRLKAKKK